MTMERILKLTMRADKHHLTYTREYSAWLCLGRGCIGQGQTREAAYERWLATLELHK